MSLSCCGTRKNLRAYFPRFFRPLPLALVASPATGGAPIAPPESVLCFLSCLQERKVFLPLHPQAYARLENFGYRKRGFPLLWNFPAPCAFFALLSLQKESSRTFTHKRTQRDKSVCHSQNIPRAYARLEIFGYRKPGSFGFESEFRHKKTAPAKPMLLRFGCPTRIRTPTNRVRVCRATVTQ